MSENTKNDKVLKREIHLGMLVRFFAGSNHGVYEMALHGFRIFATSCLLTGINVYASAFWISECWRR